MSSHLRGEEHIVFGADPVYFGISMMLFVCKLSHELVGRLQPDYSKTGLKMPLSKRPKIVFQDQLSLNAGQKYSFIKLIFVIKIFVLSIFDLFVCLVGFFKSQSQIFSYRDGLPGLNQY